MAANLAEKRLRIIQFVTQKTDAMIGNMSDLAEAAAAVSEDGRITFVDADFDVDGLRHMDASAFNAVLAEFDYTDVTKLAGWILANKSAILEKVRP